MGGGGGIGGRVGGSITVYKDTIHMYLWVSNS